MSTESNKAKVNVNMISERRQFLKLSGLLFALPVLNLFSQKAHAQALKASDLVKETDSNAKAVKYCENAEKSPKTCPDRKKKDKAGQLCSNCSFYTKAGNLDGSEVGKCVIFPAKLVKSGGWCGSWVKKA